MKFKVLILDLDGTLVTLPIKWDELREKVRRLLKTDHPLKPLAPSIPKAAKGRADLIRKAFRIIEKAELEASNNAKFDEELFNFLRWVKNKGMKVGLVTLQGEKPARKTLKRLGVLNFFDLIVTRESSLIRREQLMMSIRKFRVDPKEVIFVGDSYSDVKAGKELGLLTVVVGRQVSFELEGDLKLNRVTELRKYLER